MALAARRPPLLRDGGAEAGAAPGADRDARLVAVVADLYRACHLPPPAVVVAPDAVRFARAACALLRRFGPGQALAAFIAVVVALHAALALRGDAPGAAYCLFMAVLVLPWLRAGERLERGVGGNARWALLQVLGAAALAGAVAAAVSWLGGRDPRGAFVLAGGAVGLVACGQVLANLWAPVRARRRILRGSAPSGAAPDRRAVLLGATPAPPVVLPRVEAALDEAGRGGFDAPAPRDAAGLLFDGPAREALRDAIEAETRRLRGFASDAAPSLGRSIGRPFDTAGRVSRLAASDIEPAGLPRVLRAAVALDGLAEAACLFDGVAIVLPVGAPAALAAVPPPEGARWRRSRRAPWHSPLQWLDDDPAFAAALDLAPSDRVADRLLARRLLRMPEAARRTPAIRAMGVGRFAGALRLRPVQRDPCGALYMAGAREDPSAFVAVRDRVLGPDGAPLEHWIAVPPHVATAREAVAWSFGMAEAEYRPAREA